MLNKETKLNILGHALLIFATLIWGTSFFVLKNTLETLPVMFVLCVRFLTASLILFLIFTKRFKNIDKGTIFTGLILGVVLATAYLLQTYGLKGVSPGENAFLTSTYVVMTPFACWIFFRKKPDIFSISAGIICLIGVAFIACIGAGGISIGLGQTLTLMGAIFYCAQIIIISVFSKDKDPLVILCIQLAVVGFTCLVGTLLFEVGKTPIPIKDTITVIKLIYLCIFCTLIAQGSQIVGQRFVETSKASLILSLESVCGLFFSALFGAEDFTTYSIIGFILVFIAIIVSETKLEFITKHFKRKIEKGNENG